MSKTTQKDYKSLIVIPRKWGLLPTLDMYILREFLIKLSILVLVFVILFILSDVFNDLDNFLEGKSPMSDFFTYLLLKLPGNVRFVMPIAMLLGCMWTMAAFGKNLEVTAMRASGVSLFRCGGPILLVGFLMTMLNIYFNEALVPYTEREALVLKENTSNRSLEQNMLTYRSPDSQRNWFFRSYVNGQKNSGVMLKKYRDGNSLEWDLAAQKAEYKPGEGWLFHNVIYTPYSRDGLMQKRSIRHKTYFLPAEQAPESDNDIVNAIKDEEELPTWVIWSLVKRNPDMAARMQSIYMTVFYYRLAFPWACFLAVFLGIPLATKNERSGNLLALIMAVIIIVIYIVIAQIFLVLGKQGLLPAPIAGLMPTIAFVAYGYCKVFYHKA
ncbi:MAG: LptF/LptG family permease [Lentisphaeria bacterium]|nr:LptF/LptG family permease [Lentisphaeria bacterium]